MRWSVTYAEIYMKNWRGVDKIVSCLYQLYPVELSMMIEMFYICAGQYHGM